jgi:hypothetical protein
MSAFRIEAALGQQGRSRLWHDRLETELLRRLMRGLGSSLLIGVLEVLVSGGSAGNSGRAPLARVPSPSSLATLSTVVRERDSNPPGGRPTALHLLAPREVRTVFAIA